MSIVPVPVTRLVKACVPPTTPPKVCVPVVDSVKARAVLSLFKVEAKSIAPLPAVRVVSAPRTTAPL